MKIHSKDRKKKQEKSQEYDMNAPRIKKKLTKNNLLKNELEISMIKSFSI